MDVNQGLAAHAPAALAGQLPFPPPGSSRNERSLAVRTYLGIAIASCAFFLLAGCQSTPLTTNTTETRTIPGVALQGRVHGGQSPISGAKIYLYAVGTGGYAGPGISASASNASQSLLNSPGYVTTDGSGNFSISGDYTCGTNQQVYVFASGGNPGLASGTNNTAAGLLAGLGSCTALATNKPFIFIDEVSTIATAYALAGFATDATHISSSGTTLALTGVANAMATITNLETLGTGAALATTPAGNGTVPRSEINTLANILATCVNTTGSTASGQPCATLLNAALANGTSGAAPTDTATAAINIAHNPWANIATLYGLPTANPPFAPVLQGVPNDFTIGIAYTGGGLYGGGGVAVDAKGNVWVANNAGISDSVSEFNSLGAAVSSNAGFTVGGVAIPQAVAIDNSGNIWAADSYRSGLGMYNPSTGTSPASGYTGGGLWESSSLAVDGSANIWIANRPSGSGKGSVSEFSSTGVAQSNSPITTGGLNNPMGVAVDGSGNVWVANSGIAGISEFSSAGIANANSPIGTGYTIYPNAIAIDSSGGVWVTTTYSSSIGKLSNGSTTISVLTGGGLSAPNAIAIDGAGNVWVTNSAPYNSGSYGISEFNSSGTAITGASGYLGGPNTGFALRPPGGIAVDGSGNLWVANWVRNGGDYISEFVGVAAPVITPIVAGLPATPSANGTSNLGTRP